MKVVKKGQTPSGIDIQIEDWSCTYNFVPYGNEVAIYPKSKTSHFDTPFAPKKDEVCRFSFVFPTNRDAENAYRNLINGVKKFEDYFQFWYGNKKYQDCV